MSTRDLTVGGTPADRTVAAGMVLGLVAWNNLLGARPWHERHYTAVNLLGTTALLAVAHVRGVTADELGFSPGTVGAGARVGAAAAGPIVTGWAAACLAPRERCRLRDARVDGMTRRTFAYRAAIRIPLGTVVWEETAFRAVLPAILERALPTRTARLLNALVFGLWHVRPTRDALRLNGLPAGGPRGLAAVTGAVVGGAAVDLVLSHLRRSTGSLLAPMLVHVASNSGATVAVGACSRRGGRG